MIRTSGCTIEAFAEATGLTTQFLADVGVKQGTADKGPCVRLSDKVAYLTPPSDDAAGEGSIERKGRQLALFGLDSLELIDETDSVYLVADEIEALTLRFHDLAALAVPKVASWGEDWPALDRAAHVYVVLTAGDQPADPPAWIAEALFRDRVRLVQLLKGFGIQQLHRHRRLHDLRHTAATLWLASGESIYFVQQQLGHKDIQTTINLYVHPDQAAHRQAAQRAAAWWRAHPS
jgi:hypothetical protein